MFNAHNLASESKKINLKEVDYCNDQQTRFNIQSDALYITLNGTQTYDYTGRPHDADNDN